MFLKKTDLIIIDDNIYDNEFNFVSKVIEKFKTEIPIIVIKSNKFAYDSKEYIKKGYSLIIELEENDNVIYNKILNFFDK